MILSDFGATGTFVIFFSSFLDLLQTSKYKIINEWLLLTVTKIDRIIENPLDCLSKGKRILAIDIKNANGQELFRTLCKTSDVLIEPYRPGVMEKLNLGPDVLLKDNPRLIYARITGFGQTGPLAKRAGHDINYVAMSGILSMLGKSHEPPTPPINLIGTFLQIMMNFRWNK